MAEHQLSEFYTPFYAYGSGHDSPNQSRVNMARRIRKEIEGTKEPQRVLGIGAGRGEVEGTLTRDAHGSGNRVWQSLVRQSQFVTIDIADIPPRKLVSKRTRTHVRADSRQLPFATDSFGICTSNLSIDMLRRNENGDYERTLGEMRRVLCVGGVALLSFHASSLFDNLSEVYSGRGGVREQYFDGKSAHNPFYQHAEDIAEDLHAVGFKDVASTMVVEGQDEWWETRAE